VVRDSWNGLFSQKYQNHLHSSGSDALRWNLLLPGILTSAASSALLGHSPVLSAPEPSLPDLADDSRLNLPHRANRNIFPQCTPVTQLCRQMLANNLLTVYKQRRVLNWHTMCSLLATWQGSVGAAFIDRNARYLARIKILERHSLGEIFFGTLLEHLSAKGTIGSKTPLISKHL
jgi:hypothetical protein